PIQESPGVVRQELMEWYLLQLRPGQHISHRHYGGATRRPVVCQSHWTWRPCSGVDAQVRVATRVRLQCDEVPERRDGSPQWHGRGRSSPARKRAGRGGLDRRYFFYRLSYAVGGNARPGI